jgi:mannose-1-phosphate guanylyltransferase/mannose-6-phosphate isomerase
MTEKTIATPVILCGGSGTRLWPLSRTGFPKQFLCLTGSESLFQQAARRLSNLGSQDIAVAPPLIVTGEDHRFLASEQLREIGIDNARSLLEPVGRNTAPALTLAALAACENGNDPVLVVTPADQTVTHADAFTRAMQAAIREATRGTIVILGVKPDAPETGYGYVKVAGGSPRRADGAPRDDEKVSSRAQRGDPPSQIATAASRPRNDELAEAAVAIHPVEQFVEKPNAAKAAEYLLNGNYYWNAGMFVLKASVWLKALEQFRPDILQATQTAWAKRSADNQFIRPGKAEFTAIPSDSIDYAVMERCPGSVFDIKMVMLNAGWSDLGAWDAVWKVLPKDEHGNAHIGDVLTTESHNTLVHASSRLVSLVGVNDVIVIETADAVLVADKSRSQDVKHIVNALAKDKREEHALHRKVHRPWGWYDSIDEGGRFKVKRIMVKPKASLSLQKHHHRAEHWVVVKGTAEITNGSKVLTLSENQSTYIPLGEVHRLANPGTIPLEIIEVQSGSYLGEDDIVRFEDHYGRTQ